MTSVFDRDDIVFQVVVNHEEQYSIWPDYKAIPNGWRAVGKSGLKKTAWPTSMKSGPTCGR